MLTSRLPDAEARRGLQKIAGCDDPQRRMDVVFVHGLGGDSWTSWMADVIEPRFERLFIADSYANRRGKGTHRAIDRLQQFAQRDRYGLRADIVKHFPSIDHRILRATLARVVPEADLLALIDRIIGSGAGVLDDEYAMTYFPGDDLLAACLPRGLPIGNLSSTTTSPDASPLPSWMPASTAG